MAAEQYIIELHNYEWKIRFKDTYYGPYNTQGEAVEAAIDAAFAMGEIGIDAAVLVQDGEHQLKTEWAYPQDFRLRMANLEGIAGVQEFQAARFHRKCIEGSKIFPRHWGLLRQ